MTVNHWDFSFPSLSERVLLLCHKISEKSTRVFFSLKFPTLPDKKLKQLEFSFTILCITEIMSMNKFSQLKKKDSLGITLVEKPQKHHS